MARCKVNVLELTQVFPPPGTSAEEASSLPLTYFDLLFSPFHPVQRLFFYESTHTKYRFLASHLPNLKHSLALTLQYFYPLAGSLIRSQSQDDGGHGVTKPELRYSEGDSVPVTIAESYDDFCELVGNDAREVTRFHPLVPPLDALDASKQPVMALQITLFPNHGFSIGISIHHAVADGSSSTHFMKSWASICCSLGKYSTTPLVLESLPSYDRSVIRDPKGLERIYSIDLEVLKDDDGPGLEFWDLRSQPSVVRSTFVFRKGELSQLRQYVSGQTSASCSPYALACGFIWVCLIRARGATGNKVERFGFVTGCRPRLDPPISPLYFGNCLGICRVEAKRSDLVGEDGVAAAAAAIWKVIQGLGGGVFRGSENWVRDIFYFASVGALTVAGSPKLGLYDVDFGWGRPRKVEVVSIERTGALSLAESREEQGGIEVGLALPKDEMDSFASQFEDRMKILS